MRQPCQESRPWQSRENSNGALRYDAETETWHCAKCERIFTTEEARGATAHAETHTKAEKKQHGGRERATSDTAIRPEECRRRQTNYTEAVWGGTQMSSTSTRNTGETTAMTTATTRTTTETEETASETTAESLNAI